VSEGEFTVSKEYHEELASPDNPEFGWYRWFEYIFDFCDRQYWARVYTDSPDHAGIGGPLRKAEARSRDDLQMMARYLKAHEGVRVVQTLGSPTGGYQPAEDHWPDLTY
jgi:hypothetical protein